ncbi:MAG: peptide chain release factor N(5)-glutamine methyltransferase [Burkholderiaceae bacterium]
MNPAVPVQPSLSASERSQLGAKGVARYVELLGVLRDGLDVLDDKPEETPETALRALWLLAAGKAVSARAASECPIGSLNESQAALLDDLLWQRLRGTPLAHLTGRQHFMGIEMLAGPQALIPRRETELLGLAAVAVLEEVAATRDTPVVLDVCTGSGNLAIGMACAVPSAQVLAADLSTDAVSLARRNVEFLGLQSRVEVRQGDLLDPFDEPSLRQTIDVLVCNPPYISSGKVDSMPPEIAEHEPALAFDGGPFGVRIIQRLIQDAPRMLRQGGWLAFEVGLGQGPSVMRRMAASKCYEDIRALTDEHGDARAILGRVVASAGQSAFMAK